MSKVETIVRDLFLELSGCTDESETQESVAMVMSKILMGYTEEQFAFLEEVVVENEALVRDALRSSVKNFLVIQDM